MKTIAIAALVVFSWFSSAAQAVNLVQNPGFESGTASWTISGAESSWVTGAPHTGSNSLSTGCVGAACITTDPAPAGAWFYQDIPTVSGQSYTVSFWYQTTAPGDTPVELQVFFGTVPASSNAPGTCTGSCIFDTQTGSGWVQVTRQVVATSTLMRLEFLGRNDPVSIFVDDISVSPDAPTAIPTLSEWGMIILSSLLALGAIFTLRRQRQ